MDFPAFRKQNLLVEFASLKYLQPQSVYVSLRAGDPLNWDGVLFARKGPYAPAVLRFKIEFTVLFPDEPPTVIFNADAFHPLLAPLTTASFASSLADTEAGGRKLPPGALSLKAGFPSWYPKNRRTSGNLVNASTSSVADHPDTKSSPTEKPDKVNVIDILRYIRSVFEEETVIDSLPFNSIANQGAWYAWKAFRAKQGVKIQPKSEDEVRPKSPVKRDGTPNRSKHPSEWNWEGVWTERVKKAVRASLAEPTLYGTGAGREEDQNWKFNRGERETLDSQLGDMKYYMRLPE